MIFQVILVRHSVVRKQLFERELGNHLFATNSSNESWGTNCSQTFLQTRARRVIVRKQLFKREVWQPIVRKQSLWRVRIGLFITGRKVAGKLFWRFVSVVLLKISGVSIRVEI
jgi:hypothetical protein